MSVKFSLKRKEILIELENTEGEVRVYTLKELNGTDRDTYLNKMNSRLKMVDGKPSGIRDVTNMLSDLIALSLYDDMGERVDAKQIQAWPSSVQSEVFEMAQNLSALGDKEKAIQEAKND